MMFWFRLTEGTGGLSYVAQCRSIVLAKLTQWLCRLLHPYLKTIFISVLSQLNCVITLTSLTWWYIKQSVFVLVVYFILQLQCNKMCTPHLTFTLCSLTIPFFCKRWYADIKKYQDLVKIITLQVMCLGPEIFQL